MAKAQTPTGATPRPKYELLSRLERIEGQIRGIEGMVSDERPEEMMAAIERLLGRG